MAVARLGRRLSGVGSAVRGRGAKRVEADVARARSERALDRPQERTGGTGSQNSAIGRKALASDLRRHRVEKTMFAELTKARQAAGEAIEGADDRRGVDGGDAGAARRG